MYSLLVQQATQAEASAAALSACLHLQATAAAAAAAAATAFSGPVPLISTADQQHKPAVQISSAPQQSALKALQLGTCSSQAVLFDLGR
jgi:hypothetical protein